MKSFLNVLFSRIRHELRHDDYCMSNIWSLLQFILLRLLVRTYFLFLLTSFLLSYRRYLSTRLNHITPGPCFSFTIFVSRLVPLTTLITSMIRHLVDSWTDTASYPLYYTSLLPTLLPPANGPSLVL